ncbi:ADP-ribosylation factor-like 16 [Plakobranchus ocellatus]|uniref:ADP-ribosylation factor-like 16 n=1 Tax=Plakobranchus ocellatus TaxID=259542 RepID=A0AAV4B140_9GAST|nr:ADP-ribosylation factor-like 16 [Plakobranchus ocellatus]
MGHAIILISWWKPPFYLKVGTGDWSRIYFTIIGGNCTSHLLPYLGTPALPPQNFVQELDSPCCYVSSDNFPAIEQFILVLGGDGTILGAHAGTAPYPFSVKDEIPATIPTVGTNLMTVMTLKKVEVTVREMGGAMGPIWHNYYNDSHAIMFMIDMSRHTQVAISCVQLMTLLSHPATQNSTILVLLNKTDIQSGMNWPEMQSVMRLDQVTKHANQNISMLEISAKTGHNLEKVTKWLYQQNKLVEGS